MALSLYEVLEIFSAVNPQLKGNFKQVLEKISENDFESFASRVGIGESNYKLLLTFLSNNWDILKNRSKDEILYDLSGPLKTYLSKNDPYSLKKLTLQTLNQYKGIKKEIDTGAKGWQVIEITDPETCVRLTDGSGWCVQEYDYARDYLNHGPLYLVLRNGKRFALIHFESDSYMDPYDNPLTLDQLKDIRGNLSEFWEKNSSKFMEYYRRLLRNEASEKIANLIDKNNLSDLKNVVDRYKQEVNIDRIISPYEFFIKFLKNPISPEMIKYLLDANLISPTLLSVIISAYMQSEKTDTQKLLIQSLFYGGIDLDANDETYGTPLFAATLRSLQHIVAILLQLGCDPNARSTKLKHTPLHALGMNISPKSLDIAKMLLSYGADINAINLNGMTPLDYVRTSYLRIRFKTELEEFLISKGAVYGKDIPHKVLPK
jgi:hypothetical protein